MKADCKIASTSVFLTSSESGGEGNGPLLPLRASPDQQRIDAMINRSRSGKCTLNSHDTILFICFLQHEQLNLDSGPTEPR